MSLKRIIWMSFKRAICMTFKKGNLGVPQGGQPKCPSKRATYMSLKTDFLDISQKGHFFSMNNLNVLHHAYMLSTCVPFKL